MLCCSFKLVISNEKFLILNGILKIIYFLELDPDTSTFRANKVIAGESEPSTAEVVQKWFLPRHGWRPFLTTQTVVETFECVLLFPLLRAVWSDPNRIPLNNYLPIPS